jgi:hypothetical protein
MKNVFSKFINFFRDKAKRFPNKRVGNNISIKIEDIVLSALRLEKWLGFQLKSILTPISKRSIKPIPI